MVRTISVSESPQIQRKARKRGTKRRNHKRAQANPKRRNDHPKPKEPAREVYARLGKQINARIGTIAQRGATTDLRDSHQRKEASDARQRPAGEAKYPTAPGAAYLGLWSDWSV